MSYTPSTSTTGVVAIFLSTADYNALTSGTPGVIYTDQQTAGQPQKRWDPVSGTFVSAGGGTGAAGAPIAISGSAVVGQVLTASVGAGWSNAGGNWARGASAPYTNIAGAAGLTYTLVTADIGPVTYVSSNLPYVPPSVTVTATSLVVAPNITAQPQAQSVTAPATATFSVAATNGGGTLTYQWQRSGSPISGATSSSYTTPATSTADSGATFSVVVTNSAGSVTSSSAGLTVNAAAPVVTAPTIASQPQAQTVTAPAAATFTVAANANNGTLTYQWRKAGVAVSGATSASYTTPATSTGDSGSSFDCVVSNSAGSATSTAAALTVNASSGSADTRPGWFAAPANAATVGTAGFVAGRSAFGSNGGSTGTAVLTTTGSNYAWFAVASATVPTFSDANGTGGFSAAGTFTDPNSTLWRLYRSDYPASYSGNQVTLS